MASYNSRLQNIKYDISITTNLLFSYHHSLSLSLSTTHTPFIRVVSLSVFRSSCYSFLSPYSSGEKFYFNMTKSKSRKRNNFIELFTSLQLRIIAFSLNYNVNLKNLFSDISMLFLLFGKRTL